jgi:DnaK suppressor protein
MAKQGIAGDAAFIETQRKRLVAMRDQIMGRDTVEAARQRAPRVKEAEEAEDDAQNLAQNDVDMTIDAVEERRLRVIERALQKIDEGTYGLSDLSGDPIPKARLDAMPEALFTIQEEEAREKQQRR